MHIIRLINPTMLTGKLDSDGLHTVGQVIAAEYGVTDGQPVMSWRAVSTGLIPRWS